MLSAPPEPEVARSVPRASGPQGMRARLPEGRGDAGAANGASAVNSSPSSGQPPRLGRRSLSLEQTLIGVLAAGFFTCGALAVMQDDSWWHLRCGKLIWETRTVPRHDPFSFGLGPQADWPNHEWLAQVLIYAAYVIGGLPLMNIGIGVVLGTTTVLVLRAMAGDIERRLVLVVLILPWIVAGISARPQVFTLLGMAASLYLLSRERYYLLPPVFLCWANLHGGVALGGLLLVGCCASALLFDRRRLRRLLPATAACGAATLCTPMGTEILTFPFQSVARLKQLSLAEWGAPDFEDWMDVYFWLLVGGFVVTCSLRWRRAPTWRGRMLIVPAILFGGMAVTSVRNIPLFLMVAATAVAPLVAGRKPAVTTRCSQREKVCVLIATWLAAAGVLIAAYAAPLELLDWQPVSPVALRAIQACPQPTFNTYNVGGYLLWFAPERRVFIDSRQDPYPLRRLKSTVRAQRTGEYEQLFARHAFRSAIMEPHWPLVQELQESGWRRLYADERFVVLVRDP